MMEKNPRSGDRSRVAVVGTGMAGLVTAWLLKNDSQNRYRVKMFESGEQTSLDSASVSVVDKSTNRTDRIDVPMRAFTEGYYQNLKAMYDFLGIQYKVQPFLFSFARISSNGSEDQYFVHASNNHQLPPKKAQGTNALAYLSELFFVLICHVWFSVACLLVKTQENTYGMCETFDQYLKRICLPQYFVRYYLLPLMSAVTTCTHRDLLRFPAKDVVEYKRCITSGRQLVVSDGVGQVQKRMLKGLDIVHSALVHEVVPQSQGNRLRWTDASGTVHEEMFDKVVLAVPPNAVGSMFASVKKDMEAFPTTRVETVVHRDTKVLPFLDDLRSYRPLLALGSHDTSTQIIHLRTSNKTDISTEATHVQTSGVMVTSCPLQQVSKTAIIRSATFTRVLRTPKSRSIVNRIFDLQGIEDVVEKRSWKNGDDGVFLVGAWCWDGMVLLEGCVVSAMRTAQALGIEAPWLR